MNVYLWMLKGSTAARSFQVYGSTQQRFYEMTWRPSALWSSAGSPILGMPFLPRGFFHRLQRHNTTKVHLCNNAKYTPYDAR